MRHDWYRFGRGSAAVVVAVLALTSSLAIVELARVYPLGTSIRSAMDQTVAINGYDDAGWPTGSGTGVILDADEIITCLHVIADAEHVTVTTQDGRTLDVVGVRDTSEVYDLAILHAPWMAGEGARIVDPSTDLEIFCLGYSIYSTSGQPDLTRGRVLQSEWVDWLQHDAPIAGGFSGGGVWNSRGELVGVNSKLQIDGPPVTMATPASVVRALHAGTAEGVFVHRYPDAADRPLLWWPDSAYRLVTHRRLSGIADSLMSRLNLTPSVDSLLATVLGDPFNPIPHLGLLLRALSACDHEGAARETAILSALDLDATGESAVALLVALTRALDTRYDLALEALSMDEHGEANAMTDLQHYTRGIVSLYADDHGAALLAYRDLDNLGSNLAPLLLEDIYPELGERAAAPEQVVASAD